MDDHDTTHRTEGFRADLPRLIGRRGLLAGLALGGAALGVRGLSAQTLTATGPEGAQCVALPAETPGPFPADGTNVRAGQTVNILTEAGVIREDIRPSIGGLSPVAEGIEMRFEVTLIDVARACAPLAGHALYLWQCDAAGVYSIYGAADRNYLRGVGISDGQGRVRMTAVVPGCYPGRWPHLHFEVFASPEQAVSGHAALLTSQFALPEQPCRAAYAAHPAYATSRAPFAAMGFRDDRIFRNGTAAQRRAQMLTMAGDPSRGYSVTGKVGIIV
jgi:protocatechuate 3,4-dioxygenase beta subunit